MPHPGPHYNRAQLAKDANLRAQVPGGALTLAWRGRSGTRTLSLSYALIALIAARLPRSASGASPSPAISPSRTTSSAA